MKLLIEDMLRAGNTAQPAMIGNHMVKLDVDYKVILMSNYVSRRVIELAGRSLEIAFVYGGSVRRDTSQTTIALQSFYIPLEQRINGASFDRASLSSAGRYFSTLDQRIAGIGHSHATFDVFHSGADHANYERLVGVAGMKISHPTNTVPTMERHVSYSPRLQQTVSATTTRPTASRFSYVLPSLVFNARGEYLDAVLASRSYFDDGKSAFATSDCSLRVYNKRTSLTESERTSLDHAIRVVLFRNGIPLNINKPRRGFLLS